MLKLIIKVIAAFLVASCATGTHDRQLKNTDVINLIDFYKVGEDVSVKGDLRIFVNERSIVQVMGKKEKCIALALSDKKMAKLDVPITFNGILDGTIRGSHFANLDAEDIVAYKKGDFRIINNYCLNNHDFYIEVNRIMDAKGVRIY